MARECKTLEEARSVPGVAHIEAGEKIIAYTQGEALPAHCKAVACQPENEVTIQDIDARLKVLEAKNVLR